MWVILYKINNGTWGQLESLISKLLPVVDIRRFQNYLIIHHFVEYLTLKSTWIHRWKQVQFFTVKTSLICVDLTLKSTWIHCRKQVQFITVKTSLICVGWQLNFEINSEFNQISKPEIRVTFLRWISSYTWSDQRHDRKSIVFQGWIRSYVLAGLGLKKDIV